jgi:hypothetical protein
MTKDSTGVEGLAALINSRLSANARATKAIAFVWLAGGAAIASCLIGCGVALALVGYSHVLSVRPAADKIANAIVDAFKRSELKTVVSGTMSLAPDSEVRLAGGQTVALQDGAIVQLDPNSTIRVVGDLKVDMPQPSKRQLQLETTSKSEELPFTNYTIFKSVAYGSGEVVTGWSFDLADTLRPRNQYCYYRQNVGKGISAKYTLAVNSTPIRPSPLAKLSFDFDGALPNCIWFSGA